MSESIVTIGDHQYRYRYNQDTKSMDYMGPVGDAPPVNEVEFEKYLLFHDPGVQGSLNDPDVGDEELKESVEEAVNLWGGGVQSRFYVSPTDRRLDIITRPGNIHKKGEWFLIEDTEEVYDDMLIGEFDTWEEVLDAVKKEGEKQTRELERRGVFKDP